MSPESAYSVFLGNNRSGVKRLLVILVVGAAAAMLVWSMLVAPTLWRTNGADVHPYREAAEALATGRSPYGAAAIGPSGLRYLYPPTLLLLFGRVLTQPESRAFAWWSWMHLPLLIGIGWCAVRAARMAGGNSEHAWLIVVGLLFAPAWREVVEGQVNGLVILALLGGWSLMLSGRVGWAGALLAFAAHVKVLPLVALLVLLAQGRRRAAGWMIFWLVMLLPLSGLVGALTGAWGAGGTPVIKLWILWVRDQALGLTTDTGGWVVGEFTPWNHSFAALAHRCFDPAVAGQFGTGAAWATLPRGVLRVGASLSALGLLGLALRLAQKRRGDVVAGWTALGLAMLAAQFGHVQTWTHHLLSLSLLVPVLTLRSASRGEGESKQSCWPALAAGALYLVVFTVPAVLAVVLPEALGNAIYRNVYTAGRLGLPTLAVGWVAFTACRSLPTATISRSQ